MGNTSLMDLLFPPARQRVLALLLLQPESSFHLRQLARLSGSHAGTLARELDKLTRTGLVTRTEQGNQVRYQVNVRAPLFADLASMFRKTHGVVPLLREALAPLAEDVRLAWVFGSTARGAEVPASDVDLMVLGDISFAALVKGLFPLQQVLGREVNPVLYAAEEFVERAARGEAFARELLGSPKLWVKGGDDDLAELVGHQAPTDVRT